jgi:hypothetical protein
MYRKLFYKLIITFGLLLCFTLLTPSTSGVLPTAQAAQTAKNEEPEYWLNLKSNTLTTGKSFLLKAYGVDKNDKVAYKSDDPEIASVNNEGIVTGRKVGTTFITVTIKAGMHYKNLTCDITVGPPAFSIKFTKSRLILGEDKSESLSVLLKPINTTEDATFSSYDSSIAAISYSGRVTANKSGLTYVFAEIDATDEKGSKKFATCTVIVTNPDDVSALEEYFDKHPELNLIKDDSLTDALAEFFNGKECSSRHLVYSLNQFLDNKFNLDNLRKEMDHMSKK